jgi:thymidylate synthase (FAD)
MKIIEQSHEIISLPNNLLQAIEAAGRTCYKSEDKIGCTVNGIASGMGTEHSPCYWYINTASCSQDQCYYHSAHKFTKMLLDRGHYAMIEFGDITVRFITNRGVTHELVRHRLCSFAQESTRYVKYDGEMEFIRPVWWTNPPVGMMQELHWIKAMEYAEQQYGRLLSGGWRPEQAREVLPNSLKTEIMVKANIREWRHIFALRTSKKAHPQMRALMLPLLTELQQRLPVVFDDI